MSKDNFSVRDAEKDSKRLHGKLPENKSAASEDEKSSPVEFEPISSNSGSDTNSLPAKRRSRAPQYGPEPLDSSDSIDISSMGSSAENSQNDAQEEDFSDDYQDIRSSSEPPEPDENLVQRPSEPIFQPVAEAAKAELAPPPEQQQFSGFTEPLPSAPMSKKEAKKAEKNEKKKKRRGLFGRKKAVPDFDETEDMYYGLQMKNIDEYTKGFNPVTGEFMEGADGYAALFDDSKKAIDDEVEENFKRLQDERRRRVAQAVEKSGADMSEMEDELGVVAPMPVTSFAADPYAKQHGLAVEGSEESGENLPEFQRAMIESTEKDNKTMEIKLNVLNDTVELQRVKDVPAVSEESVKKILENSEASGQKVAEDTPAAEPAPPENGELSQDVPASATAPEAEIEKPAKTGPAPESGDEEPIPHVSSIFEYRSRRIPTHVINADVLQSALISESDEIKKEMEQTEKHGKSPFKRSGKRKTAHSDESNEKISENEDDDSLNNEDIDDYTGPADASAVSHEIKGDMGELTLRMLLTGFCTLVLAVINAIFGSRFSSGAEDLGSMPIIYILLTLVFVAVSIGICYKSIANGLKALLVFTSNSDSAAAFATIAVVAQTIVAAFFSDDLIGGSVHLYAVILTFILFLNSAGKLTMVRRIHSNFRFVTSKEQKYCVRVFDDHNTALKMAKDSVISNPAIAYQTKAGFLKRFLMLSYSPDPAEIASQIIAPIGVIASLTLCVICLIITSNVPVSLSALAASSCACVAFGNMLTLNLPVSKICKRARRAGAMIVGFCGINRLADTNAVMISASDLFPRGTVVLEGIKTFSNRETVEATILQASAVAKIIGEPLSTVFEQVISENEDELPEVSDFKYFDGLGISATVDGNELFVGNRALMLDHHMEPLSKDDEAQLTSGNKQLLYIGKDGRTVAILVLTYTADRRRRNEIQRLEDNGVSLIINSTDANVTPSLVSRLFGIDSSNIQILQSDLSPVYEKLTNTEIPRADANIATKGKIESMMNTVCTCIQAKSLSAILVMIQNIAVVLGFVLVAFLACFNYLRILSSFVFFIFEIIWLLMMVLVPKIKKP